MWEWTFISTFPHRSAVEKVNISGTICMQDAAIYRGQCMNLRRCKVDGSRGCEAFYSWTWCNNLFLARAEYQGRLLRISIQRCLDHATIIRRLQLFRAKALYAHGQAFSSGRSCVRSDAQAAWTGCMDTAGTRQGDECQAGQPSAKLLLSRR